MAAAKVEWGREGERSEAGGKEGAGGQRHVGAAPREGLAFSGALLIYKLQRAPTSASQGRDMCWAEPATPHPRETGRRPSPPGQGWACYYSPMGWAMPNSHTHPRETGRRPGRGGRTHPPGKAHLPTPPGRSAGRPRGPRASWSLWEVGEVGVGQGNGGGCGWVWGRRGRWCKSRVSWTPCVQVVWVGCQRLATLEEAWQRAEWGRRRGEGSGGGRRGEG